MTNSKKTIAQRLLDAGTAINNTLANPEILTAVTVFGYDQARLEAAQALHAEVVALTDQKYAEYGVQYAATAAVRTTWKEAAAAYSDAVKIARIVFRDNGAAQTALGLNGRRKQSLSGWLEQARLFYNNMLRTPSFIVAMTPYTYTQAKLEAEAALVEAVSTANEAQEKERGDAQEATKNRNLKLNELDRWLADYKAIAEIALAASPQKLEQLGWVVPS